MNGRLVTVVSSSESGGLWVYALSCGHSKVANFRIDGDTDCLRCLLAGRRLETSAPAPVDLDAPVSL